MRGLVVAASIVVWGACRSKDPPAGEPEPKPALAVDAADWRPACAAALERAASITPARRVLHVIEGCRPYGDWTPLLAWNTPPDRGGPTRVAIVSAMDACKAYCNDTAKARFLAGLDDARGQPGRGPWKALGEVCKEAVSAVPDARFMSAPYFALDRIARAVAAEPALAALANVTVPLPAASVTGVAFDLPASPVMKPDAGPLQLTVIASDMWVGTLPSASLAGGKVTVDRLAATYPGTPATAKDLGAALDELAGNDRAARITVIIPPALPATRLLEALAAAGPRPLVLAAAAAGAPTGWTLPGTVPVALATTPDKSGHRFEVDDASLDAVLHAVKDLPAAQLAAPPTIAVGPKTTVASVAKLLGTLAFRNVAAAALVAGAK